MKNKVVINQFGDEFWRVELDVGWEYHREVGPAIIFSNGVKKWYKKGKCHRDGDLPAVIWPTGTKEWYKKGKCHRDGDLPAIVFEDGSKQWYKNGELIREEG